MMLAFLSQNETAKTEKKATDELVESLLAGERKVWFPLFVFTLIIWLFRPSTYFIHEPFKFVFFVFLD